MTTPDALNPDKEADVVVRFGWNGVSYEIPLTVENADAFEMTVAPYVVAATVVEPQRRRRRKAADLREWAKYRGIEVAPRGRIPNAIKEQYRKETGNAV